MKISELQALKILADKYKDVARHKEKLDIINSYLMSDTRTARDKVLLSELFKDDALALYQVSDDVIELFTSQQMQQVIRAVTLHTKPNLAQDDVIISVGESLLMVINSCKKASLDPQIIHQLKTLYLDGVKSNIDNEFITDIKELLADQKQFKVSKEPGVINADPTRRYFETHLTYHLLNSNAERLDVDKLRAFNVNLKHNLWKTIAHKTESNVKLNLILNGTMHPSLDKYQLEYAELIKQLNSNNYHGLSATACKNLAEIAKTTIIATLNTQHDKSMPADIYTDSIFTMGMDGRGRIIKKTHDKVLTGLKGIMQSTCPLPPGDISRDGDIEQYEEPLYQDVVDEYDRLVLDKNKNIKRSPVTQLTLDQNGLEKETPIYLTRERMVVSAFQRSADQAKFMMESQWSQHLFGRLTQVYSNGISSTTLATLRNILMQKREGNPFHREYFEQFMVSFAALMIYNSGGHSLFEIFEVFKLPQLSEILEESGCNELVQRDELMQQWLIKDNSEQFDKALDETLIYMEQLISRRITNAQLKNWATNDGTLKIPMTDEVHDVRKQLAIDIRPDQNPESISLHRAVLTLTAQDFIKRLNAAKKLNLNIENSSGYTPLMVAAQLGKLEHVKALIKKGADPFKKEKQNMRALELAIKSEKYAVVNYLLTLPGIQATHKDFFIDRFDIRGLKEQAPALYFSCRQNDMRILRKVIQKTSNLTAKHLTLAIQETVKFENIEGAMTLIALATPKQLNRMSVAERQNILNMAAERGNVALLGKLLESKISLDQAEIDYNAMVFRASKRGYLPIVRLLLSEAFQIETPLKSNLLNKMMKSALINNQYDLAVLFIIYGANIDSIGINNPHLDGFTQYLRTTPPEHFNTFFSNRDRDMINQRANDLKEQYTERTTGVWRAFIDVLVMFLHQLPLVNLGGYYQKTEVVARLSFQVITNEKPKKDYEIGYGEMPESKLISPDIKAKVPDEQNAKPSTAGMFCTVSKPEVTSQPIIDQHKAPVDIEIESASDLSPK